MPETGRRSALESMRIRFGHGPSERSESPPLGSRGEAAGSMAASPDMTGRSVGRHEGNPYERAVARAAPVLGTVRDRMYEYGRVLWGQTRL